MAEGETEGERQRVQRRVRDRGCETEDETEGERTRMRQMMRQGVRDMHRIRITSIKLLTAVFIRPKLAVHLCRFAAALFSASHDVSRMSPLTTSVSSDT